jgi:Fur family zinc uptake transcriptional regulator
MVKGRQRQAASDRNDALISSLLDASEKALSAYDIIEALHPHGISSPPTVYRSLARLVAKGQAHRVESLNAFVSCKSHTHGHNVEALFAICNACGTVTEFNDSEVAQRMRAWAQEHSFKIEHTALELRGSCSRCADASSHHTRK